MPNTKLKNAIKAKAYKLGFHLVGVTTSDPPPHLDVYYQWLESGHHAGMGWMGTGHNRQRRADPKEILPKCLSILVLGIAYPPSPLAVSSAGEGRIASYAWGDDYHDVLPIRLAALVDYIEAQLGIKIPNHWYTDTGPVLEKEMAQRAGLGWIGKNSCLINPRAGSYFLLAEILLGIELTPDEPNIYDHCGSCTRCIDACPTHCILPNRTVDANRCISYLTIEEKGTISPELRTNIGNWLFGCDVCQQVCPWNQRFATRDDQVHISEHFKDRSDRESPTLIDELNMTPQAFNGKFKGSPVKRTKRRGYLRNVAVALGNSGDPEGLPALTKALFDHEPLIRGHAAWALGKIGGELAIHALKQAVESETDHTVIAEIKSALSEI